MFIGFPIYRLQLVIAARSTPRHHFHSLRLKMSQVTDEARAKVADEVKIDLLSSGAEGDNELKRSQIARTFICECSLD